MASGADCALGLKLGQHLVGLGGRVANPYKAKGGTTDQPTSGIPTLYDRLSGSKLHKSSTDFTG